MTRGRRPARLPAGRRRPAPRPRPVSEPQLRSCLIVGTGLIGTSIALALRAHDVRRAPDRSGPAAAARQAAQLGAGTVDPPGAQVDLADRRGQPVGHRRGGLGLLAGNVAATVVDTAAVKPACCATSRRPSGPRRTSSAPTRWPVGSGPAPVRLGPTCSRAGRGWCRRPGPTSARWRGCEALIGAVRRGCRRPGRRGPRRRPSHWSRTFRRWPPRWWPPGWPRGTTPRSR